MCQYGVVEAVELEMREVVDKNLDSTLLVPSFYSHMAEIFLENSVIILIFSTA